MKKGELHISNLVQHLEKKGEVILLESQMKNHPASGKTLLAGQPKATIKAWGDKVEVTSNGGSKKFEQNPLEAFSEFRKQFPEWMFGYFGYDLKNFIEKLSSRNKPLINAPDLYFMIPEFVVEFCDGQISVLKGELPDDIRRSEIQRDFSLNKMSHISKEEYLQAIIEAKNRIKEGDFYEVNLSHPIEFEFEGRGWELYQKMKEFGPVPFASYIKADDFEICSSSPERFLAKKGSSIWSQPIKGTVSRNGKNDEESIQNLLLSEKDRAENLMIVDLVRNDLSRVAHKGSVEVNDLFEIQSFETVHQMVSTVKGELKENMSEFDILKATFPMGSMTGAPKISAMKAIEELENYKRGIYSGAIGYFKPDGNFDFNVVIRTAIVQGKKVVYPVGGAITADSIPEKEWEETLIKARAITGLLDNF